MRKPMSYNCHLCNCVDCRLSRRCCKSCNGSGEKAIDSCAEKVPMEIAPAIAIAALQLVFNIRDPHTLGQVLIAAEGAMVEAEG